MCAEKSPDGVVRVIAEKTMPLQRSENLRNLCSDFNDNYAFFMEENIFLPHSGLLP
jgi:hypothetical protein